MSEVGNKVSETVSISARGTPPIRLKQNYSVLPQKSITLKDNIGGLAGPRNKLVEEPVRRGVKKPGSEAATSRNKNKPDKSNHQWTLRGVSSSTRDAAVKAAKQQGIPLGLWVEQAISQALDSSISKQTARDQQILERLADIQASLVRIQETPDWLLRLKLYLKAWWG
jgi:hypothetical protein